MTPFYEIRDKLQTLYPEIENSVSQEILESGKQVRVPAGTRVRSEYLKTHLKAVKSHSTGLIQGMCVY